MKLVRTCLPFLIGLFAGIYFVTITLTGSTLTYLPGDLGDTRFNNYLLEHAHLFFTGQVNSFWDAPFMYPEQNVISYSDNLLGTAPFYSVFRILGSDRESSFQFWFICMSVLNYTSCYFFLLYIVKNHYSAAIGAMVFAFSIALQSQMAHAQTFPRFAIPITFWLGLLYLKELKPTYFFGMLFFLVYEIYCGIYLGFMLSVPVAIFLLSSVYFKWELYKKNVKSKVWLGKITAAVALNVAILMPLMIPYLERSKQIGVYPYEKIKEGLPTILSFFFSHDGSFCWGFLSKTGLEYPAFWDHQIFPGGIATLSMVAFIGIVTSKLLNKNLLKTFEINNTCILLCIISVFTFLFFMRFQNFSFYKIIHYFPGFGAMRALQRIITIELLFYAVAVSFVFNFLFRKENKLAFVYFVLFTGIVIADNYIEAGATHRHEKADSQQRVHQLTAKMSAIKPGSIISYEPDTIESDIIHYQLDAMLASQSLKLKCLNGYSATSPYGFSYYWVAPNEETRRIWLKTKEFSEREVLVVR